MELYYIKQIIEGDTSQFSYFVDRYKDMAFSIACRFLKNKEDAEEVVQDSFVKAFTSLHKFRQDSKFSTWFYKIVVNSSLSKAKNKKDLPVDYEIDDVSNEAIENIQSAYIKLNNDEQKRFINLALERLNAMDGLLLTLYYLNENPLSEIVEITGIRHENVKMKLHRARKKMYMELSDILKSEIKNILL